MKWFDKALCAVTTLAVGFGVITQGIDLFWWLRR